MCGMYQKNSIGHSKSCTVQCTHNNNGSCHLNPFAGITPFLLPVSGAGTTFQHPYICSAAILDLFRLKAHYFEKSYLGHVMCVLSRHPCNCMCCVMDRRNCHIHHHHHPKLPNN